MNRTYKHIFFDLDHTLWDFDKNSALTFEKIFEIYNVEVDVSKFLSIYEPVNSNYWKLYREDKIDKAQLRYGRLKDSFDTLGHTIEDRLINILSDAYIEYLTSFNHLFEHTQETLEYLRPRYKLHIITNGFQEAQQKKIEASNLQEYFQTITNSEMVGVKKPNPLIFNHAMHLAKARPEESLMVGDNLEADILGALNVGLDAIFFNIRKDEVDVPVKQIQKLSDLKLYL